MYDPVQGVLLDERFARNHGLATFGGEEVDYGGPVTVGGAGSAQHVVTFARDGAASGLVVRSVAQDSPAAEAGLQPGDRLLAVNDNDASQWTRREWQMMVHNAVAQASDPVTPVVLTIRILRDGTPRSARLTLQQGL